MRILYSYASFNFTDIPLGGEERVAWETVSRMARKGHLCYVMAPEISLSQSYENIIPITIPDCAFRESKARWKRLWKNGRFLLLSYYFAKKMVCEQKIDLIHHIRPAYPGFYSPLTALKIPFVYGGITLPYRETKGLYGFLKRRMWEWMLKDTNLILCEVKRSLDVVPPKLRNKCAVLYNGVDTSFFRPRSSVLKSERVILLFVGRVIPLKGIDVLLEALFRLKEKGVKSIDCLVVGGGDLDFYRAWTYDHGMDSWVQFLGIVGNRDLLLKIYQEADIFVLPSRKEVSSNVLFEAMSCGLPVVASDVMGIPEIMEDGMNGLLVPPEDPEALARAIEKMVEDERWREECGKRNREKMVRNFDWEIQITRLESFYQRVLEGSI